MSFPYVSQCILSQRGLGTFWVKEYQDSWNSEVKATWHAHASNLMQQSTQEVFLENCRGFHFIKSPKQQPGRRKNTLNKCMDHKASISWCADNQPHNKPKWARKQKDGIRCEWVVISKFLKSFANYENHTVRLKMRTVFFFPLL